MLLLHQHAGRYHTHGVLAKLTAQVLVPVTSRSATAATRRLRRIQEETGERWDAFRLDGGTVFYFSPGKP
jgi:hypothetical protein